MNTGKTGNLKSPLHLLLTWYRLVIWLASWDTSWTTLTAPITVKL